MWVYSMMSYMNSPQCVGVDGVGPTALFGSLVAVGRTEVSHP